MNEAVQTHQPQTHRFQAEVTQVLDIVVHSLYTHREIFLRELISNAADALEKVRYEKVRNEKVADPDLPLDIRVDVNEEAKTITVTDTGIGMTEGDTVENLGTIAHSGTREFLKHISEVPNKDMNLIGKFGVGFYASFMVAKKVTVYTRSYLPDAAGVEWQSDGSGEYTLRAVDGLSRGTRIVLELREDAEEFASKAQIERIIKQYSNFVPFPIYLNGEKINRVQALWTRNRNEIGQAEYTEFYRFISNSFDDPLFRLHFSADAPIQIHALLFTPTENMERFGFGHIDPGVNLYCRKVLIQEHSNAILPNWLRFVKGAVDSEDLPLNISRETFQDDALVRKLRKVVTSRYLKHLNEQAKEDPEKYKKFWSAFHLSLKEGVASDIEYRDELLPLLRFESSNQPAGEMISLNDYLSRMKPDQKAIYYLNAPSRQAIETGPYIETFRKRGIEVVYVYEPVDDFVMNAIGKFEEKPIQSADRGDLDLPEVEEEKTEGEEKHESLGKDQADTLSGWIKNLLGDRVTAVRPSKRLVDSPAIIVNQDPFMTVQMQRYFQAMNQEMPRTMQLSMEINPGHPIMLQLSHLREQNADDAFLKLAVEQIYENALTAAGMMTDPQSMVNRNYEILQRALSSKGSA